MSKRRLLAQVGLIFALFAALWLNQERGLKAVAVETHSALCALRLDVEHRRDRSLEYLQTHPRGLVGNGGRVLISRADIERSLRDQHATLVALSDLSC